MANELQTPDLSVLHRSLRGSALGNYIALGTSFLASWLIIPAFLGTLGAEKFGLYSVAMSLFTLLQLPFGALDTAATQIVSASAARDDFGPARVLLRIGVLATLAASTLLALLALLAVFTVPQVLLPATRFTPVTEVRQIFALVVLAMPLSAASHLLAGICNGLVRFRALAAIRTVSTVAYAATWLLLLHGGTDLFQLLLVWSGVVVSVFLAQFGLAGASLMGKPGLPTRARPVLSELGKQGGWLSLEHAVNGIAGESDKYIVSVMLSASAAGYYAIGFKIPLMLLTFVDEYTRLYVPMAAAAGSKTRHDYLRELLLTVTQRVLVLFLPVAALLAVWARPLLSWWLGNADPVVPVFRAALVVMALLAAQEVVYALVCGLKLIPTSARIAFLQLILRIGLALVLVRPAGLLGVAGGVLCSVLVGDVLLRSAAVMKLVQLPAQLWTRKVWLPALAGSSVLLLGFQWSYQQAAPATGFLVLAATLAAYVLMMRRPWTYGRAAGNFFAAPESGRGAGVAGG